MMNKGVRIGLATVCTGMLAVGGYGAYNIATAVTGSSTPAKAQTPRTRTVVAEAPSADQAAAGAKAFLDAWAAGDLEAAGALTDRPDPAVATLTAFRDKVKPTTLTLAPSGPAAATAASPSPSDAASPAPAGQVLLGFKATATFAGASASWQYDGSLGMVRMSDGKAAVHWTPRVIHPHLGSGQSIAVQPVLARPASITDRNGKSLTGFPSLTALLPAFKDRLSGSAGDAGTGVVITDGSGGAPEQLFTITEPKPAPSLKLTLDADLQAAAESAVKDKSANGQLAASLVAIEPSSGDILAIANSKPGFDQAFLGGSAPGSTMKIITATALLEAGITPDTVMPCPGGYTVSGQLFQNDKNFAGANAGSTMSQDFAQSCNTAFIKQGMLTLTGSQLEDTALQVFGIGPAWRIGLPLAPAQVPAPDNPNRRAAQLIGQGRITMNSLTMASVAATVQNGTFHQPILIPGAEQLPAGRSLSHNTLLALRQMMSQVVTTGTAKSAMAGLTANAGGKTGTAQVDGKKDNSWFTGYKGNLAVAAEFDGGGFGADTAAPAVAQVLRVGNNG